MTGCACIYVPLHINIQAAVLIETIKALSSDLCWCSCKLLSTQDNTVAIIAHDEYDAVFS